jgi:ABC-2 type transport system ATP-binding protein
MTPVIEARNLRKIYGDAVAIDGIDLSVEAGRIVGVIGPNGAGKTTLLNAVLGLTSVEGELRVLGRDPWIDRDSLMCDVSFITDVAVLPHWIKVEQLLAYVTAIHPRFNSAKATPFLERTSIRPESKVKDLSKGMVTQLHLAIVMAIDAQLLVLDEPTLGLDILYRKKFYDSLLEDYYDKNHTIVLATHDIEEIEHVVTDVIFLDRGRIALSASMDEVELRYREVKVHPASLPDARRLSPIYEREALGQRIMIFDGVSLETLAGLGDVRTPSVADLFVAQLSAGDRR